jgi:glutaredoxin
VTPLLLLTAPDCHLCKHGKAVLDELGVAWHEVECDSEAGRKLAAGAPPMRPVLYGDDGRVLGYGRLSRRRLRKQLNRGEVTA